MYASYQTPWGNPMKVKILLEYGADVNAKNLKGKFSAIKIKILSKK